MADRVVHFEVTGPDGEALKRFYASIFGWSIDSSNPMSYGLVPVPRAAASAAGCRRPRAAAPGT
jgi:predicted enzyme related to lactoylglutathione lyase